jgi:hypothetical protein
MKIVVNNGTLHVDEHPTTPQGAAQEVFELLI